VIFTKGKVVGNLDFEIEIPGGSETYSEIIQKILKIEYHPEFLYLHLHRYAVRLEEFLEMRRDCVEIMEVPPDKIQILAEAVEPEKEPQGSPSVKYQVFGFVKFV
jgi:hypothetical protein